MGQLGKAESPVLRQTFQKWYQWKNSKVALKWALLNIVGVLVLYVDISFQSIQAYFKLSNPLIFYAEVFLMLIFSMNIIVDLMCWLRPWVFGRVLELTPQQMKLLGVSETDPGFKVSPPKAMSDRTLCTSTLSFNTCPSPQSSFMTVGHTPSPSCFFTSASSYSPSYSPYSPSTFSPWSAHSMSPDWSFQSSSPSSFLNGSAFYGSPDGGSLRVRHATSSLEGSPASPFEQVSDMHSLTQYLKQHEKKEIQHQFGSPESLSNSSMSYWSHGRAVNDHTHILRKYPYQVACRTPQSSAAKSDSPEESNTYIGTEVWSRLGVTEASLYRWIERLRKWISLTIVVQLAKEISEINETLRNIGSEDTQIGEVSVGTLRQVCLTKGMRVPNLITVLPYLDLSSNQEYLVKRIKDLGKDGCMNEFIWNRGGDYSKEWGDHLPTDAALVMHLFCTYMDSRLPINPRFPVQKTFTSQHFLKIPNKPDINKKDNFCIYQCSTNPPHFQVILGEYVWNLPRGRNNILQALLLFLHHIKTKENGMLGYYAAKKDIILANRNLSPAKNRVWYIPERVRRYCGTETMRCVMRTAR